MPKQKVVRYDVWLRGGVAPVASEAEGERASPWWEGSWVGPAGWLDVGFVEGAPVLHSVAEILKAHARVRCEVLSESRNIMPHTSLLMAVIAVIYGMG
jgi:hypothetical protein